MSKKGKHGVAVLAVLASTIAWWGCETSVSPIDPPGALEPSAAQRDHEVVRESFDFTQENVCLGESVHWTGEIQVVSSFANNRGCCDPGVFQHLRQYSTLHLEGEGLDTGTVYSVTGYGVPRDDFFCAAFGLPTPCVFDFGFEGESPIDPFPVAGRPAGAKQRITAAGEGLVAEAVYHSIFVVNANGELVVFDETFENIECFVVPPAVDLPFTF